MKSTLYLEELWTVIYLRKALNRYFKGSLSIFRRPRCLSGRSSVVVGSCNIFYFFRIKMFSNCRWPRGNTPQKASRCLFLLEAHISMDDVPVFQMSTKCKAVLGKVFIM